MKKTSTTSLTAKLFLTQCPGALFLVSATLAAAWWYASGERAIRQELRIFWVAPFLFCAVLAIALAMATLGIRLIPVWETNTRCKQLNRMAIRHRKMINYSVGVIAMPAVYTLIVAEYVQHPLLFSIALMLMAYVVMVILFYANLLFLPHYKVELRFRGVARLHLRGASYATYSKILTRNGFDKLDITDLAIFLTSCGIWQISATSPNITIIRLLRHRLNRAGIQPVDWAPEPMTLMGSLHFRCLHRHVVRKLVEIEGAIGWRLPQAGFAIELANVPIKDTKLAMRT